MHTRTTKRLKHWLTTFATTWRSKMLI
jgi:hypothetical protein